jgi:ZIP family zinc transporter
MSSSLDPFVYSLIAGMGTGIGGLIALFLGKLSNRSMGFLMGFASGVMLMVSFNNLFCEAIPLITHIELITMFSLGALMLMALDLVLPHIELTARKGNSMNTMMFRRGVLIAIGITLHNLPEGLVVTAGYAYLPNLGFIIAISIMLHNIPEGIATAIPLKEAGTKSSKTVVLTFLSGLAEPIGALLGIITFSLLETDNAVGYSLAFAAGVMTYITADELIPVAHEYGVKHTVSVALLIGIIFTLLIDTILS